MDTRRIVRVALVAVLGIMLVAGLTGCKRAAEAIFERTTGIEVDEDAETVTVTGDDGEEMKMETGSASLPTGWPSDMPVYSNADIEGSTTYTIDGETSLSVVMTSGDSFDRVFDWYRSELVSNGWTIDSEVSGDHDGNRNGNYFVMKGDKEAVVTLNHDGEQLMITSQVMVP